MAGSPRTPQSSGSGSSRCGSSGCCTFCTATVSEEGDLGVDRRGGGHDGKRKTEMRNRRLRFSEDDDCSASPRVAAMVDANLTPEAAEAAHAVEMALIEQAGRRAVAVFLRRDDCDKLEFQFDELMANVIMECLGRFVRDNGGQVAKVVDLNHDVRLNPTLRSVAVNGEERSFVRQGYVFIHFPHERVAVSAKPAFSPDGGRIAIAVRSDCSPHVFFRHWESYARERNFLRGKAFFADGQIIEREKKYTWDSILIPDEKKEIIRAHTEGFLRNVEVLRKHNVKARRGLILAGEPGTGKSLLGKVLADTLDASFIWVLPRHIQGPESFRSILSLARMVAPAVLFLEDLDLFAADREARCWLGLGELMNQLDGVVDNENVITIATTNRLGVIENALRNRPGRFDRTILFEAMDEPCRRTMFTRLLADAAISHEDMTYLIAATEGCTGAQLEEIANTIFIHAVDRAEEQGLDLHGELLPVDRASVIAAIGEVVALRKQGVGFHAA